MLLSPDERTEELETTAAIYPELQIDPENPFAVTLDLAITPAKPLLVRFIPLAKGQLGKGTYTEATYRGHAHVERDVELSHLPPLRLHMTLPDGYPENAPPIVTLSTAYDWLPQAKIAELEAQAAKLWDEYGCCQVTYLYIEYLESAAQEGFNLDETSDGLLILSSSQEQVLVAFDAATKLATFNAGTYDCGICLEPKKGSSCYQMTDCAHIFCSNCLHDFYNNAITEGDVANVRCLDPQCGKEPAVAAGLKRKRKTDRALHPQELLAMGIDEAMVRRYVDMKRKKKLEADKNTIYCPRIWCQGPARSPKYPPIPADLATYVEAEPEDDDETESATQRVILVPSSDPHDRLAICERCDYAFCRVCKNGWHGPYARCTPRDLNELSAAEKASYDYIAMNTSPCPTCNAPSQKTYGCNHMQCYQCNTHFCYLCSSWLDRENPYAHFNKGGTECYQRLWELEEGDEGQAPEDGRGYVGARRYEQMAIDAAREAEAAEAAERAAQADPAQGLVEEVAALAVAPEPPVVVAWARDEAVNWAPAERAEVPRAPAQEAQPRRRRRNPFAQPPAAGDRNAQAVRNHERGGRPAPGRRAARTEEERQQQELQRFLEMAIRDEEEGWNSDELDEDDFVIR